MATGKKILDSNSFGASLMILHSVYWLFGEFDRRTRTNTGGGSVELFPPGESWVGKHRQLSTRYLSTWTFCFDKTTATIIRAILALTRRMISTKSLIWSRISHRKQVLFQSRLSSLHHIRIWTAMGWNQTIVATRIALMRMKDRGNEDRRDDENRNQYQYDCDTALQILMSRSRDSFIWK